MKTAKILCLIGVILLLELGMCAWSASATFKGAGTREDPYLIENAGDLSRLATMVNDKGVRFENNWFRQVEDIDLKGIDWIPIGLYDTDHVFYGVYDGNGKVISHMRIQGQEYAGFFGSLGGICMNLGLVNGKIEGTWCGGISSHAASVKALIYNCYTELDIRGIRVGGIADNFIGSIFNCWSTSNLKGETKGTIVSYGVGKIDDCFSQEDMKSDEESTAEGKTLEEICQKLNGTLYVDSRIGYKDVNEWQISNDRLWLGEKKRINVIKLVRDKFFYIAMLVVFAWCMCFAVYACFFRRRNEREAED